MKTDDAKTLFMQRLQEAKRMLEENKEQFFESLPKHFHQVDEALDDFPDSVLLQIRFHCHALFLRIRMRL